LGYDGVWVLLKLDIVLFVVYSNDHLPRHVHEFAGETEVIVDLRLDGNVALAKRNDAIRPSGTKTVRRKEGFEYGGSAF
jgi:hypothetical protein